MSGKPHLADSRFHIRPATKADVGSMTEVFMHSFNAPFGDTYGRMMRPTESGSMMPGYTKGNKVVAWSRWMVPQYDGNLERKWPEPNPDEYDMDVCGAFFGGMEENRLKLMGERPHWFLEMLATHENYQRMGIGASLIKWGTDQADKQRMETYLDGSEKGEPYYKRWHNFKYGKDISIPDRPQYGSFHYVSLVRPPQS